jgi:hypothetical protein
MRSSAAADAATDDTGSPAHPGGRVSNPRERERPGRGVARSRVGRDAVVRADDELAPAFCGGGSVSGSCRDSRVWAGASGHLHRDMRGMRRCPRKTGRSCAGLAARAEIAPIGPVRFVEGERLRRAVSGSKGGAKCPNATVAEPGWKRPLTRKDFRGEVCATVATARLHIRATPMAGFASCAVKPSAISPRAARRGGRRRSTTRSRRARTPPATSVPAARTASRCARHRGRPAERRSARSGRRRTGRRR